MSRFGYPFLLLLICLPVALLALGVPVPGVDVAVSGPTPLAVPAGDRELAWLHTTTNANNWERFVRGVVRATRDVPGLQVDDSHAYQDTSTAVPEVVISMAGRAGNLRVRWYKLSSEANADYWIDALAAREPAPLAIIGGGSTDRAVDLARALNSHDSWHGGRPLLLLTQATADTLSETGDGPGLLGLYPGRTFRFCFTNRQMAEAVLDFVLQNPELRPVTFEAIAPLAVTSGVAATAIDPGRPTVFAVEWEDDPFSVDLNRQFKDALCTKLDRDPDTPAGDDKPLPIRYEHWSVPYSVGGQVRPNRFEADAAGKLLEAYRGLPPRRSLLILPAVTTPARRLLRGLSDAAPQLSQRFVAVTGDGISLNSVYRDGLYAWPVQSLAVPLVFFTHNNPVAWDEPDEQPPSPAGYALEPPTGTEDVLLYSELIRVVVSAAYGIPCEADTAANSEPFVVTADELAERLKRLCPEYFDEHGNRVGGSGEYVVVVRPVASIDPTVRAADPVARIDVWRRGSDRLWEHVRRVDVDQWRTRTVQTPGEEGAADDR